MVAVWPGPALRGPSNRRNRRADVIYNPSRPMSTLTLWRFARTPLLRAADSTDATLVAIESQVTLQLPQLDGPRDSGPAGLVIPKNRRDGAAGHKATHDSHGKMCHSALWAHGLGVPQNCQVRKGTRADMANFRTPPYRSHLLG